MRPPTTTRGFTSPGAAGFFSPIQYPAYANSQVNVGSPYNGMNLASGNHEPGYFGGGTHIYDGAPRSSSDMAWPQSNANDLGNYHYPSNNGHEAIHDGTDLAVARLPVQRSAVGNGHEIAFPRSEVDFYGGHDNSSMLPPTSADHFDAHHANLAEIPMEPPISRYEERLEGEIQRINKRPAHMPNDVQLPGNY